MQDQNIEETSKMYDAIIQEVVTKLKQKSERGNLSMSESEIQEFTDKWIDRLREIRKGPKPAKQMFVQMTKQEQVEEDKVVEDKLMKKVKISQDVIPEQDVKREIQDDDDKSISFESANNEEEGQGKQEHDTDFQEQELVNHRVTEESRKLKVNEQKERTLFDKIRELNKLEEERQKEFMVDPDDDVYKDCDVRLFAEKLNGDSTPVTRIKPNKSQKLSLENVVIKQDNRETFLQNSQLQFNFKTQRPT